eukprot:Skav225172  [mRNA]  locus=scaffold1095:249276:251198:- [translate_table: standard]
MPWARARLAPSKPSSAVPRRYAESLERHHLQGRKAVLQAQATAKQLSDALAPSRVPAQQGQRRNHRGHNVGFMGVSPTAPNFNSHPLPLEAASFNLRGMDHDPV